MLLIMCSVTAILEDMDDFFTYSISIDQIILRV